MSNRIALSLALVFVVVAVAAADEVEPKSNAAEIKKLKVQRRDVLKKALTVKTTEFTAGRGTLDTLVDVSKALLQAELAIATKKEERVAAHKARFDLAKEVEEMVDARYNAGRCTAADQ